MNQLPHISRFSEEEQLDGQDWLEQFQPVAQLGGWDEHAKLVNLTTRLRGPACSFYNSCSVKQQSSYRLLVEHLVRRFIPVQIKSI